MVGACVLPVCVFSIAALGAARAFDDPTLIDVPLNVEPAGGEEAAAARMVDGVTPSA